MNEEAHWFTSQGNELFGILTPAENSVHGTVLLLHGFTSSHLGPKYSFVNLARRLAENGYNVFRFDYGGSGDSEGDFSDQNLDTAVTDAINAVEYLDSQGVDVDALGFVGHSMGGSVAILAGNRLEADVVVTWSTVADYEDAFSPTEQERLEEKDTLRLFGVDYPTEQMDAFFQHGLLEAVTELDAPVLIAHGRNDYTVPFSHAESLYDAAQEPKKLVELQADHLLHHPRERKRLLDETADWIGRQL